VKLGILILFHLSSDESQITHSSIYTTSISIQKPAVISKVHFVACFLKALEKAEISCLTETRDHVYVDPDFSAWYLVLHFTTELRLEIHYCSSL
jgi:hypothetical protein